MKFFKPILLAGFSSVLLGVTALAQPAPSPSFVRDPAALASHRYDAYPYGVYAGKPGTNLEPLFFRGQLGACPGGADGYSRISSSRAAGAPEGCFVAIFPGDIADTSYFGVIGDGVADDTDAINRAVSYACNITPRPSIYNPPGDYYVTDEIALCNRANFYGAGNGQTRLVVDQAFSPLANGVLTMGATLRGPNAARIHDLVFSFRQPSDQLLRANYAALGVCTSGTGGTGCMYAPAIYGVDSAGFRAWNVQVANGWDGFLFVGNAGAMWLDNIEMGAAGTGLTIDGALDFVHIKGWHNWPYSDPVANAGFLAVYRDGNTVAWDFGEIDGLNATDVNFYFANVSMSDAFGVVQGAIFDGGCLSISGGAFLTFSGFEHVQRSPYTCASVTLSGGNNVFSGVSATTGGYPFTAVSGGRNAFYNFDIRQPVGDTLVPIATQTGTNSHMRFSSGRMSLSGGATAVTKIESLATGTSSTVVESVDFSTANNAAAAPLIVITTDGATSSVRNNNLNQGRFVPPGVLGAWGPNEKLRQETIAPTVTFSTPGNFVPANVTGSTTWFPIGSGLYYFKTVVSFDTNAYTTAAGSFQVVTNLPIAPVTTTPVSFGLVNGLVYSNTTQVEPELQTTGNVLFRVLNSGGAATNLGTAAVPASTAGFTITVAGIARYQ